MTTVWCAMTSCEHNQNGACPLDYINIYECECYQYEDYTDGVDYQSKYFKRMRARKKDTKLDPSAEYKLYAKGKRLEVEEYVLYTEMDDRYGLADLRVTEERTGLLFFYKHFQDEEKMKQIRAKLPQFDDVSGKKEIAYDNGEYLLVEKEQVE